ncbi:MAG: hypothetical protein A2Z03_03035 [Chloroflexi bacterium RBG_16_56_8]|nr:MAG: hypothetical protein A2Z03_03035 [Chloroflexi bacterium RBG_16_56_8]
MSSTPLEQFLIEYVDAVGGLVDEIEPQVYDVLLPDSDTPQRLAFDPDALPEHPSAQLLTFGSALLDDLLARAQARGQIGLAFLDDAHLMPHALAQRVTHDLILPDPVTLRIETIRPLYVTHSLFWFEVTYLSDEKEQALHLIAVDRYYGREVRYLEALLDGERLSETRRWAFADAPSLPLDRVYLTAREAVVRTVRAEVHTRQHQTQQRLAEQTERMKRYYADLRAELAERIEKAHARGDEIESLELRRDALNREETLRLDELARKAQVRVQLRLVNLLHVKIPRLLIHTRVSAKPFPAVRPATLTLTWDPLVEKTDALVCPNCQQPTFELQINRQGELHCPKCAPTKR